MSKEFQGMSYPGWKIDYRVLKEAREDDLSFNIFLESMKRKQKIFDGDRSHPKIVVLDAIASTLTYQGWKRDVKAAESLHPLW